MKNKTLKELAELFPLPIVMPKDIEKTFRQFGRDLRKLDEERFKMCGVSREMMK